MAINSRVATSIVYFEHEGRSNLSEVIKAVEKTFRRRADIRSCKLVIFTGIGEGPALAYSRLQEYDPQIIAVTFPPEFSVKIKEEQICPRIHPKLQSFFRGVNIKVITGRLPFDPIEGASAHNDQMRLIRDVLSLFGGSFSLCIQGVLQACDAGEIEIGQKVVGITGDCAAVITASTTQKFLSSKEGLSIHEIICKPRNLNLARSRPTSDPNTTRNLFEENKKPLNVELPKLLPKSVL